MAPGNKSSERMTASPRNTCVPGVQAYAAVGSRTSTAAARTSINPIEPRRVVAVCARVGGRGLDAESLPLSTQGATQVVQLLLDHIIDGLLRLSQVVADVIANLVSWYPFPQLGPRVACPRRAPRT